MAAAGAPPAGGAYTLGFTLTPLTASGGLDVSGDFKGGPHPVTEDPIFKMMEENRDGAKKLVEASRHEEAIGRYSELIMQSRALENETDVEWTDAGRLEVRQLRAAAYLNLSLCFLKTSQWQHAVNTATRAIQGDKDPPDPKEDVLPAEKKAKALFRRAQAYRDGLEDLDKAEQDLKKAAEYAPDDKTIQQELNRVRVALAKVVKAADKKLAGFLSGNKKVQSGEGIFSEESRQRNTDGPQLPKEPVKVSDGLWVVPDNDRLAAQTAPGSENLGIDYDELGREISELREEKPEVFAQLREKMKQAVEQELAEREAPDESPAVDADANTAALS